MEKYRNSRGQLKENLFLPLFNTNFISKSFGGPLHKHAGKDTRHFGLILVCPHLFTPIINQLNKKKQNKGFTDHKIV